MKKVSKSLLLSLALLSLMLVAILISPPAYSAPEAKVQPKWTYDLPAGACRDVGTHCHQASPVIADMDNDGVDDLVVATNNGHIVALKTHSSGSQATLLWDVNIASAFGGGANEIASAPAVADIDNDGRPEVVVGVGTTYSDRCTVGGIIALEHTGAVKTGWPVIADDFAVEPSGCPDTVYSTPALADMDGDGDLEIMAGGFDKIIYVLHHDGSWVDGHPVNSYHYETFGWPILIGRTADTIWASPVAADMDGDGQAEMILGTDEGNYDDRHNVDSTWTCPYPAPIVAGYCGGSVYILDGNGVLDIDRHQFVLEAIQSTPAMYDLTMDGVPEIFIGAGTFYNRESSTQPTIGQRVHAWDGKTGAYLPGWENGKVVGGNVPGSPAIGDIAGDNEPEVVIPVMDGKIYAWHMDGTAVSGFPMTPVTSSGDDTPSAFNVSRSPILADYDGDGKMEIFISQSWNVTIIDGNGQQLTTKNFPTDDNPLYIADGRLQNNPVVGDIDGDGELELVVHNSRVTVWDLPAGAVEADWPMFKYDAARTSYDMQPNLLVSSTRLVVIGEEGGDAELSTALALQNVSTDDVAWTASATRGSEVTISETSGALSGTQLLTIEIKTRTMSLGSNDMGSIILEGRVAGQHVAGSPRSIPIEALLFEELNQLFLPFASND